MKVIDENVQNMLARTDEKRQDWKCYEDEKDTAYKTWQEDQRRWNYEQEPQTNDSSDVEDQDNKDEQERWSKHCISIEDTYTGYSVIVRKMRQYRTTIQR